MTPDERQELWRERIRVCKESGMSTVAWCKENGINQSRLYYWKKRLREMEGNPMAPEEAPGWIRLAVSEEPQVRQAGITVHVAGATIEVQPGFNRTLLREVIQVLTTPC